MERSLDFIERLPVSAGSYALHLRLDRPAAVEVGRLGRFDFPSGDYLYLGSARGPGGLRARLRHHLRVPARLHWHIDALTPLARITGIWYSQGPVDLECLWSQAVYSLPLAVCASPGFGAADCRRGCTAHLAAFPHDGSMNAVEWALRAVLPVGQSLQYIAVESK